MTNFFKMALMGIFAVGAFAACSDSDDDNGGGATPEPEPVGVPTIELSGAQTSGSEASSLTFSVKQTDATSAKYLMTTSSELQNAMTDATLEELILENGTDLSSEQLGTALSGGLDLVFKSLEPIMEYTCAIYAINGEQTAVKAVSVSTSNGSAGTGTGTDAYNAWLGTWNVTSSSSIISNAPLSFTVTIEELQPNMYYALTGWGISEVVGSQAVAAEFNPEDGKFYFINGQEFGEVSSNGMTFMVTYIGVCGYNDAWTIVTGEYNGLIGTMDEDGESATFEGETLVVKNTSGQEVELPVYTFDFFAIQVDGNQFGAYNPAPGFNSGDYPIPPYTMTKSGTVGTGKTLRTYFAAPQAVKTGYPVCLLSSEIRSISLVK